MRIIHKSDQIGFCYGVRNAIKIASLATNNPNIKKPIYLLGSLVHNHHVNEYFEELGIIILQGKSRLQMLDEINDGTVIFTAHGVSDNVLQKAKEKNLNIIDATCPYVERTVNEMKKNILTGHEILFIGKSDHPETETALTLSNNVHIVDESLKNKIINNPVLCHQTTMSSYDVEDTYLKLKEQYPTLKKIKMVCKATELRQNLILKLKKYKFNLPALIIIVGDKTSNNSTKLYEMALRINLCDVIFIDNINELDFEKLKKYNEIHLYGGTSTPKAIIDELYDLLSNLDNIHSSKINSSLTLNDYINK